MMGTFGSPLLVLRYLHCVFEGTKVVAVVIADLKCTNRMAALSADPGDSHWGSGGALPEEPSAVV